MIFWVAKFSFAHLISKQNDINSHPIAETLIHWYSGAKRDLPWRKTKDPYVIWVSEIILQQTRVDQGLPYFNRFIDSFPSIEALAGAPENEVLSQWQGLGYYSRARNMHAAAKFLVEEKQGQFPEVYDEIIKLKGVGPYTAAAIASICFNEARPVVDGNVFRVASRLFGLKFDISLAGSRKEFVNVLNEIIPTDDPGTFNQAIMEYGATICKPSPNCDSCSLIHHCHAHAKQLVKSLPVKSKKTKVREREINYLVIRSEETILLKKRGTKDIWQGMYDFPTVESREDYVFGPPIKHVLSHQLLFVRFATINLSAERLNERAAALNAEPFSLKQMLTLPKPKVIDDYYQETLANQTTKN